MPWYANQEIINQPFQFPKNLKDMTEAEKDRLRQSYLEYQGSLADDEITLNPTSLIMDGQRVGEAPAEEEPEIEVEDPEVRARVLPQFRFDPVLGYIVDGEDPQAISSVEMSEEDRKRILQRPPRHVSDQQAAIHKIAAMGPVERMIEDRFGDL